MPPAPDVGEQPMPPVSNGEEQPEDSSPSEYRHRRQLLLLAALVVSVTYVAGLSPPGGVWREDGGAGVTAGWPILRSTHRGRYLAFFYCNATALVASLVIIFLLLLKNSTSWVQLAVLRLVMVLDLLGLMGAYLAGSCRERTTTVYAAALVLALSAYVGVHILQALYSQWNAKGLERDEDNKRPRGACGTATPAAMDPVLRPKERNKVLLLLATFATAVTYVAGLNPPGGFWDSPPLSRRGGDGGGGPRHGYRPGDSLVEAHHSGHYRMFFYCNSTAFVASLFIIVLLHLEYKKPSMRTTRSIALHAFVLGALVGLVAAYDAGSCRDAACSVYVVSLLGAVLAFIFVAMGVILLFRWFRANPQGNTNQEDHNARVVDEESNQPATRPNGQRSAYTEQVNATDTIDKATKKVKSLVLLLANLAATITYQAGLDPPGGFWPDDRDGHRAGDAILLSKQPTRYRVFFYCNSTAFVASLVAILMVQNVKLVKSHTLLVAMMLDMFALMGAYAAGSCRDVRTSAYVVAMAGVVLLYVLTHVLFFTLRPAAETDGGKVEKTHKRLLLVAILVATITYQVGLTPPGGFWTEDQQLLGHRAGDAILLHSYSRRFRAFFYCNTASFMASIALILLLVNPNLSRLAIRCYALYACQVAGLCGLMGAYAAGSARRLRTSIFVFALVGAVIAFIAVHIVGFKLAKAVRTSSNSEEDRTAAGTSAVAVSGARDAGETRYRDEVYAKRKYLMLLGILAASVTYQAGLAPPGGLWQNDGGGFGVGGGRREAGNPVLHDTDGRRYHVFFYSNSTSFVASVVVIALLLQQILRRHGERNKDLLLLATNTAVVLDLLGLLAAYTAGSTRQWGHVVVLPVLVVLFMAVHAAVWLISERRRCSVGAGAGGENSDGHQPPPVGEQVLNGHGLPSQVQGA